MHRCPACVPYVARTDLLPILYLIHCSDCSAKCHPIAAAWSLWARESSSRKQKKLKRKSRYRRCTQLTNTVTENLNPYHNFRRSILRNGAYYVRKFRFLPYIVIDKEVTIEAIVIVMMSHFDMSDALSAVVMLVNGIMMHMHRRQYHHRQISSQQYDRRYMSKHLIHLSDCKITKVVMTDKIYGFIIFFLLPIGKKFLSLQFNSIYRSWNEKYIQGIQR